MAGGHGGLDVVNLFGPAFHLAQDRVEGVLECPVDGIALSRPEFLEIAADPLTHLIAALAVGAAEVPGDLFAGE
jgi:hypothetical protein